MLKKTDIPAPSLTAEETVPVPELGGDVLVRGMTLASRLEASRADRFGHLSVTLSECVFVDDVNGGKVPLFTSDEWERWGAKHYAVALNLWNVVFRLSDLEAEAAAKNLTAQTSVSP